MKGSKSYWTNRIVALNSRIVLLGYRLSGTIWYITSLYYESIACLADQMRALKGIKSSKYARNTLYRDPNKCESLIVKNLAWIGDIVVKVSEKMSSVTLKRLAKYILRLKWLPWWYVADGSWRRATVIKFIKCRTKCKTTYSFWCHLDDVIILNACNTWEMLDVCNICVMLNWT